MTTLTSLRRVVFLLAASTAIPVRKVYTYDPANETVSQWFSLEAFPAGWTHGATVAAGWFE